MKTSKMRKDWDDTWENYTREQRIAYLHCTLINIPRYALEEYMEASLEEVKRIYDEETQKQKDDS